MVYMDVIKKIEELKLIPVVTIENSENAVPLGQALIEAINKVFSLYCKLKDLY